MDQSEFTFSTSGVADGNETITITPVQNALWDIDGTVVSNYNQTIQQP